MRYFTRMQERSPRDTQERVALLLHRLNAIKYHRDLLTAGSVSYAFHSETGEALLMYDQDSQEQVDWLIKRDPHFAYTSITVIPVVSTEALVREAQDYLAETIIPDDELHKLNSPVRKINPNGEYWLAWKEVPPFSPLLPVEDQDDVHRRTVLSQEAHLDHIEFADDNPVGRPVGIMIAESDLRSVEAHVKACAVYPDTIVTYMKLWTLEQAWTMTRQVLLELRPSLIIAVAI